MQQNEYGLWQLTDRGYEIYAAIEETAKNGTWKLKVALNICSPNANHHIQREELRM